MPIYEYRCPRCGHTLEVMQKISDPAPSPCPGCQGTDPLERLVSRTSFQLKGGGWYSDLYGSVKKDAKADAPAPAPAAKGEGAAKPAAPAAAAPASSGGATSSGGTPGGSSGGGGSGGGSTGGGSSSGSGAA